MTEIVAMLSRLCLSLALLSAQAAHAASDDEARALFEAMRLGDVAQILREEGQSYGADLEAALFPGSGGAAWDEAVNEIYAIERIEGALLDGFAEGLSGEEAQKLQTFFTTEPGREIIYLEIEARRAMQDPEIEAIAVERAADLRDQGARRLQLIEAYVVANDLVDMNVAGSMNFEYAVSRSLSQNGAFEQPISDADILAGIWARAPEIRIDIETWLYGYLALAYQPLGDDDLDTYIELSESPAGQALNAAIFASFDAVYAGISRDLGQSASRYMQGEDI